MKSGTGLCPDTTPTSRDTQDILCSTSTVHFFSNLSSHRYSRNLACIPSGMMQNRGRTSPDSCHIAQHALRNDLGLQQAGLTHAGRGAMNSSTRPECGKAGRNDNSSTGQQDNQVQTLPEYDCVEHARGLVGATCSQGHNSLALEALLSLISGTAK